MCGVVCLCIRCCNTVSQRFYRLHSANLCLRIGDCFATFACGYYTLCFTLMIVSTLPPTHDEHTLSYTMYNLIDQNFVVKMLEYSDQQYIVLLAIL